MKASILTGIRRLDFRQVPDPKIIADSDVLIRMQRVGVCGSDIHYFKTGRIGDQIVHFPFVVGHEGSGIVMETGTAVKRVKRGDRIAIDPAVSCGHCDQCRSGREHTCRTSLFLGCPEQISGCLCEYVVLPQQCCYPLKENMTFEQGALTEPLSIGVYAVKRSAPTPGMSAAILGAGPIGMSVFHVLRTMKTGNVFITDKIDSRLKAAASLNPVWSGNPTRTGIVGEISNREPLLLDVVYECSGDTTAIRQGIEVLKPGGKLVLVGVPETDEIPFPIHELRRKEITVINIRRQVHCTQTALDLLDQRRVVMDPMVTHRFSLEETGKAFDLVANYEDGVMKAMITIE
jgi:L-iditol 2-dehydrogenase